MSVVKNAIKKFSPSMVEQVRRTQRKLDAIESRVEGLSHKMDGFANIHDSRLDRLKASYSAVEPYQPIYNVRGIGEDPKRSSDDRAERIYEFFNNNVKNLRTLDIGCSLGYISFYLADKGAIAEGWDYNAKNIEVCRYAQEITGIQASFSIKELNLDTVEAIQPGQYDVVMILSLLHHITALYGVEYTQKILKALLDRIPVMVVELALKGEDPKLGWDKALPKNELDIFGDLSQYTVKKLGVYPTHLSAKKRPLYAIQKKSLAVRNHYYEIHETKFKPFEYAPRAASYQRAYYFSPKAFIKQYSFTDVIEDNKKQIFNEINFYLQNNDSLPVGIPKLKDFDVRINQADLVFERVEGGALGEKNRAGVVGVDRIAHDVLDALIYLEGKGLYHNDIRSWNIMATNKRAYVIDFGLVSHIAIENNTIAFIWALWGVIKEKHEDYNQAKESMPEREEFQESEVLLRIYDAVKSDRNITFKELKSQARV